MHLERLVERRFSLFKKKIWFVQMHHNVDHAFSQSIYPFSTSSLLSKKLSAFMHHFNCMHLDLFMQPHSNPRRSQRTTPKAVASSQFRSPSKIANPPNQQQRKHHHHPKRESKTNNCVCCVNAWMCCIEINNENEKKMQVYISVHPAKSCIN